MMSILNPLVHIFRKLLTTNLKCFVYSGSSQVSTSATNVSGKNLSLHIPYHLIDSSMDATLFHKKNFKCCAQIPSKGCPKSSKTCRPDQILYRDAIQILKTPEYSTAKKNCQSQILSIFVIKYSLIINLFDKKEIQNIMFSTQEQEFTC